MSMSILNTQEASGQKAPLPPLSAKRLTLLVLMGIIVFAACVLVALRVYPGPYREIDYLIMGTISVGIALLVIFLGMLVNRRKLFIRTDEEAAS
jgi:heme A synthase